MLWPVDFKFKFSLIFYTSLVIYMSQIFFFIEAVEKFNLI